MVVKTFLNYINKIYSLTVSRVAVSTLSIMNSPHDGGKFRPYDNKVQVIAYYIHIISQSPSLP